MVSMTMSKRAINPLSLMMLAAVALAALLSATTAIAEQQQTFDNHEIHYNAFNSTSIPPEVAQSYELTRSRQAAVMNIAVLDTSKEGKPAVKAIVKGEFKNLIGQVQTLTFKLVEEGDAIYYIASFRFTDQDVFNFTLDVQPDPNKPAYQITFSQKFYAD